MCNALDSSPPERYTMPDQFLVTQIDEYNKSGQFINQLAILSSNGWPANLEEVISLVDLLQLYVGAKVEYVVQISKKAHNRYYHIEMINSQF